MACLRQLRTEDDVFPMILTFFQRCNVSTHTLFPKYIISLMNIMNNSWSRSNQTTPAFVRNCSKPSFELFVNCYCFENWNRFASKIKKPWKIYFCLSKFLENYLELNMYLKKIIIHEIEERGRELVRML